LATKKPTNPNPIKPSKPAIKPPNNTTNKPAAKTKEETTTKKRVPESNEENINNVSSDSNMSIDYGEEAKSTTPENSNENNKPDVNLNLFFPNLEIQTPSTKKETLKRMCKVRTPLPGVQKKKKKNKKVSKTLPSRFEVFLSCQISCLLSSYSELMRSRSSGTMRAWGEIWWMVDAMMREEFSTFSIGFMLSYFSGKKIK
jgi:hypothetical protein